MKRGKIIVIEGACDGIGKTTQYQLLKNYLEGEIGEVVEHHFPTYEKYQGKGVENYLSGNFGAVKDLNPYFINNLYANDRAITWYSGLKEEYENGKTVLLDRYTTSSLIYQATVIEDLQERIEFLDYVCDLEYEKIGIGKPDKVIFLCAPFDLVTEMRLKRKNNDGVSNDVHERDLEFMKNVYDNALFVAERYGWDIIECSEDGKMKSIDQIHKEICERLN